MKTPLYRQFRRFMRNHCALFDPYKLWQRYILITPLPSFAIFLRSQVRSYKSGTPEAHQFLRPVDSSLPNDEYFLRDASYDVRLARFNTVNSVLSSILPQTKMIRDVQVFLRHLFDELSTFDARCPDLPVSIVKRIPIMHLHSPFIPQIDRRFDRHDFCCARCQGTLFVKDFGVPMMRKIYNIPSSRGEFAALPPERKLDIAYTKSVQRKIDMPILPAVHLSNSKRVPDDHVDIFETYIPRGPVCPSLPVSDESSWRVRPIDVVPVVRDPGRPVVLDPDRPLDLDASIDWSNL